MLGGIFKSKWTRAIEGVTDFIVEMLKPYGKIPASALRDPYCIGFLEIVGVHVASDSLPKGSGMKKGMVVFEEALKSIAPRHFTEATEVLSFLRHETSPSHGTYLQGRKDGDLYIGWKQLSLAPQRDGQAIERFFDRIKQLDSPQPSTLDATPDAKTRRPANKDRSGEQDGTSPNESQRSRIKRVSSNVFGKPMLEIDPAPLDRRGVPDLSESLAQLIIPHLQNRDNISIRYIDDGLPTTATAVLAFIDVEDDESAISYSVRIMLFETDNKKVGSNVHIRPIQRHVKINGVRLDIYQEIKTTRTYDFLGVYDNDEQSRDDLGRLVKLAHEHFIRHGAD
jgi:hypothetical protein